VEPVCAVGVDQGGQGGPTGRGEAGGHFTRNTCPVLPVTVKPKLPSGERVAAEMAIVFGSMTVPACRGQHDRIASQACRAGSAKSSCQSRW